MVLSKFCFQPDIFYSARYTISGLVRVNTSGQYQINTKLDLITFPASWKASMAASMPRASAAWFVEKELFLAVLDLSKFKT